MSHDGSWRAACLTQNWIPILHFEAPSVARGVTAPGVGSGALLAHFSCGTFDGETRSTHFYAHCPCFFGLARAIGELENSKPEGAKKLTAAAGSFKLVMVPLGSLSKRTSSATSFTLVVG